MKKLYYSIIAAIGVAGTAMAVGQSNSGTRVDDTDGYSVVGTYDLTIVPTDMLGSKETSPADIQVEVRMSNDAYCLAEVGGTNYFQGYSIPFSYNETSKLAVFEAAYSGETSEPQYAESPYLWVSAFIFNGSFTEPQHTYAVKFDTVTGFEFSSDNDSGFAWFTSDSDEQFSPWDVFNGFYVYGESDNGSDEPGEDYGDASIEGTWEFTLNGHYIGDWSAGEFTTLFTATLDGNIVTFESSDSQYNIVAEFTAENTLTFKKTLVGNPASVYGLWQSPYVNTTGVEDIEDLTEEVFSATYNSFKCVLTFPENSGLAYGIFSNATGDLSYWDDAFDFVSAAKQGAAETPEYADSSIEGEWDITLNGHYLGDYSLGEFTETFVASLDGAVVTFESTQSQYNIVAEFVAANTLKFNFCPVRTPASYTLYQSPYINFDDVNDIEELTEQAFVATFSAEEGVIKFPEYSGLRYGYFDEAGNLSYWDDAFDFVSAIVKNVETPIYGDESIEGNWNINLDGHYLGAYSLGMFTESFEASLDGNIVTFESSQSQYNIVAEFVAANTLKFNFCPVSNPATYTLYQSPYLNYDDAEDIEELTEQSFVATYLPEEGVIKFPEYSGLRYGYFDAAGNLSYWDDAFDFVSASKAVESEVVGQYIWTIQPTDITGSVLGEMIEIKVEVNKAGDVYTINELDGTKYFNNQVIPFAYNEETEFAQFTAKYAGELDGQPVWMSAFVYNNGNEVTGPLIEVQENFGVTFNTETGFEFKEGSGFAWFVTTSAEDFDAQSVYSAFYVVPTGVSGINGVQSSNDGETIYYDLQGRKVNNPTGGLYIMKQGNTAKKVMLPK